jgi:general L-amino acid transport system permease protein
MTGDAAWRGRERAQRWRQGLLQVALGAVVVALLWGLFSNLSANLQARQIKSGFAFLADPAGFNIGELLFEFTERDSYLRAFAMGMANTLRVALAGIGLACFLGVVVGLMRLSRHGVMNALASTYVEVLRNTPLVIQLLAIYLLVTELLPDVSAALAWPGVALLSKQGLQFVVPQAGARALGVAVVVGVLAAVAAMVLAKRWWMVGAGAVGGVMSAVVGLLAALVAWLLVGAASGWSAPVVDGFLISGGAALTPEFLALWLGLSLYTSAFIAELVRAGALAVPRGQSQAAMALGLSNGQTMAAVVFPQALRLAVPPLSSQAMNLIKNSSLGVVIGYPDLVSIANTSINQNGQALEVIVIIMAVYLSLNLVVAVVMGAINRRVTRAPR